MSHARETLISAADDTNRAPTAAPAGPPLTKREREILARLAEGMSGAQIAEKLVLSPETVRTHVRNAMAKLGASTRSQAVAMALQQHQISSEGASPPPGPSAEPTSSDPNLALESMLRGLVTLYDVDGGGIYLAEEDGLSLRRMAVGTNDIPWIADQVALGDGALGRAALERRAQLLQGAGGSGTGTLIAAPMVGRGRLLGVIALVARISRPIGRSELAAAAGVRQPGGRDPRRRRRGRPAHRAGDGALPRVLVERPPPQLAPARAAQISVSASARSEASTSVSIGATASTAQSSSTRRIGERSGTTSRSAWRRAASRRPSSKSRWMPELSR